MEANWIFDVLVVFMTVSGSDKDTIAGHAPHALVSVSDSGAGSTTTGGGLRQQSGTQVTEQRTVKSTC